MSIDTPLLAWALLAIAAALVELLTPHFGLIFVTVGALAAVLVAWLGGGMAPQLLSFAVVVTGSVAFLRPRVMTWMGRAPGVPSRTSRLTGQTGVITQAIEPTLGAGRVTVAGEDWAAHCRTAVAVGTEVRVVGSDGIVLEVLPL